MKTKILVGVSAIVLAAGLSTAQAGLSVDFHLGLPLPPIPLPRVVVHPPVFCPPAVVVRPAVYPPVVVCPPAPLCPPAVVVGPPVVFGRPYVHAPVYVHRSHWGWSHGRGGYRCD